ncbi:MAG: hypothetical protein A3H52_01510 [Candidatus Zambryskibacteria bacterium RIFCSPLOWO2_02_FULL_39_26]|uniref:Uncharacterized protein n=1 Tax=Candidatus Zambryskibacteria bacterium RIFCSPLOWO2_12_FULL_39_23 TaxID=1802776 RepID=A0A1G2URK7_9BACT|nr:MAG: hypothetical protein A2W51_00945 [Candidatus Zambryskibacteria bacterium RIFCSPHIGHO2_02_39_10]OHA99299.1 MAG: hypothetical protein A3E59_00260 [Candidatus Zambryskibacteria bacterium RIFCSPHIGHO2_12_FULL_39_47]OHB10428.1 MAG: hypothetical protein A3H52_01510 [Candidatus Zambryskibacteria bacterium RIFCSPLOWO2_02_FULL_39_26]OHB11999.1 MAG: hypothetical protein A3G99_02855 [Candidatus Zambryskibacteria bacterium RIFCSPLOWO2_12_FULL_39_23]
MGVNRKPSFTSRGGGWKKSKSVEENNTVVAVPVATQPIAVPVETGGIAVGIQDVPVAIRVAEESQTSTS